MDDTPVSSVHFLCCNVDDPSYSGCDLSAHQWDEAHNVRSEIDNVKDRRDLSVEVNDDPDSKLKSKTGNIP